LLLILTQNSRASCVDRASGVETWSILKVEQQGLYRAGPELSVQKRSPEVRSTPVFSPAGAELPDRRRLDGRWHDKPRPDKPRPDKHASRMEPASSSRVRWRGDWRRTTSRTATSRGARRVLRCPSAFSRNNYSRPEDSVPARWLPVPHARSHRVRKSRTSFGGVIHMAAAVSRHSGRTNKLRPRVPRARKARSSVMSSPR
jgi:hypothetical protein